MPLGLPAPHTMRERPEFMESVLFGSSDIRALHLSKIHQMPSAQSCAQDPNYSQCGKAGTEQAGGAPAAAVVRSQ